MDNMVYLFLCPSRSLHPVGREAPKGQGDTVYTDNGKLRWDQSEAM